MYKVLERDYLCSDLNVLYLLVPQSVWMCLEFFSHLKVYGLPGQDSQGNMQNTCTFEKKKKTNS